MAKKPNPKTADPEAEEAGASARGGKKKLVIAAVAALALAGGGGFYLVKKPGSGPRPDEKKPVAFVDIQEMTVNLASEPNQDRPRFLKFKVVLEVKDAKIVPDVQPLLPRVQDIFQMFVRELRPSDLEGSGGIHKLREELLRRVNIAVAPTRVDAVLFKEVVVQ
jgi:flagellar FliL protein